MSLLRQPPPQGGWRRLPGRHAGSSVARCSDFAKVAEAWVFRKSLDFSILATNSKVFLPPSKHRVSQSQQVYRPLVYPLVWSTAISLLWEMMSYPPGLSRVHPAQGHSQEHRHGGSGQQAPGTCLKLEDPSPAPDSSLAQIPFPQTP